MLTIVIPKNNIKERKYLLDIVFGQFLKITYNVKVFDNNISEYRIFFNNKKSIIIKDSFFSLYPVSLSYLKKSAIPENVNYILNPLFSEKDLPVFFGEGDIAVEENRIITDIDIFSTIFFMLTRWEEYVSKDKDQHGRFPHTESLAYKYNFIHRPIVNEYIEFLWNMLVLLGCKHKRYKHKFSILLTHDVDHTLRYLNFKMLFVRLAGDIVLRKSIIRFFKTVSEYIAVRKKEKKDPYDTFDKIMDISDSFNIKSHFFFMSGGTEKGYDNNYKIQAKFTRNLIKNIHKRGHYIGIHPSYNAYNNMAQFEIEKKALEAVSPVKIISGREHYLRFEVPKTWQIWEDQGFSWCSNMAYANKSGFRAGVCYPFTPFNILIRKQLSLKERPLIMMEGTFMSETKNPSEMEQSVDYYLNIVKKYNGEFVLLWHNSNFNTDDMIQYRYIYKKIIKKQQLLEVNGNG